MCNITGFFLIFAKGYKELNVFLCSVFVHKTTKEKTNNSI